MIIALFVLLGLLAAYLAFVCTSVALPRRLRLALGPMSLERTPDRAARRHRGRVLFTSDEPCSWSLPGAGNAGDAAGSGPDRWTARDIQATAGRLAAALRALGLRHGQRVAVLKRNHLDIHLLHLGVVRAGGVACPMNGAFAADKVAPYLVNIDARILFADVPTLLRVLREGGTPGRVDTVVLVGRVGDVPESDVRELHGALRRTPDGGTAPAVHWIEDLLATATEPAPAVRRGPREPLYLVHTSGTTGFPKAVILRNGPQSRAMRGWLCYVHISPRRDRGYMAVPNNHQAVILTFHCMLLLGVRAHWTAATGRDFDALGVVEELARDRYTGFFGFPITYTQLREVPLAAHDLRAMRFWASTADAAHEAMIRPCVQVGGTFRRLGLPLRGSVYLDAQGSSEVGTPSVLRYYSRLTRRYDRRIGRRHSAPFGPGVRIARDGVPVSRGQVGRLEVRGKTLFEAYWNNHSLTYEAVRDGWFFTGDVARWSGGHVVQLDREVDVIRTGGGDVYSLPIEERVHRHPAVFDTCVYGARQPDGTQRPAAAVALRPGSGIGAARLRDELNALLAPEEQLVAVEILPWSEFPVGVTGKTLKRVFRERTEPLPVPEANRPVALRAAPAPLVASRSV
ncbi:AMP-dependent synthetase [Parafrankia colletiae]|uniref:AMP-dependent synthetase n=1 Tax=Parafrankia colletiae TaxID=573497 RepID=A0A1S1QT00_9ACTN|nr:class I adenylate-forming enzyme family protein [Parafrankia colletiae]MCK9900992.1 acyl--CoA ligase [Frankia sp. Cpl3]OHV36182.1 AMP-dependent synthetase [Parafrankia colletiae]